MTVKLFTLLSIFYLINSYGQTTNIPEITIKDFEAKALSGEKYYDALILRKDGLIQNMDVNEGISGTVTEEFERILILNEAGLKYAVKEITSHKFNTRSELIQEVGATTYNLKNGKIVKTVMDSSSIWNTSVNKEKNLTTLSLPNVRVGSIIEIYTKKISPYPVIDDVMVQHDLPINLFNYDIILKGGIVYSVVFNPLSYYPLTFDPELKKVYSKNVENLDLPIDKSEYSNLINENQMVAVRDQELSLSLKAIPALPDEPFTRSRENYRAKIIFEIIALPDDFGNLKRFSASWSDITSNFIGNDDFGKQLGKSSFFRRDLKRFLGQEKDEMKKAQRVLEFLKSKVKWNSQIGKYTDQGVKDAYKTGSGNVAEINILLNNMFNEVGLQASPILSSSKNNGIPLFPTHKGFNYVLVEVIIDGKEFLIDGTEKFSYFNILPSRSAHWKGRLIQARKVSHWVNLEDQELSKKITITNSSFNENFVTQLISETRMTGQHALRNRNKFYLANQEEIDLLIHNKRAGVVIENSELFNLETESKPFDIKYSGFDKSSVKRIGDKIYIRPLLNHSIEENPYNSAERKLPLDLFYPSEVQTIVNLSIPDDYEVYELPDKVNYQFQNGLCSYKYSVEEKGSVLSSHGILTFNTSMIKPEDYNAFKLFFTDIVNKNAEKIVLKKKS